MTDICASELFSNQTICEVIQKTDDLLVLVNNAYALAESALDTLRNSTETEIQEISGIDYSANTSGVNTTYSAPSVTPAAPDYAADAPTAPTIPTDATEPLISEATVDDRFADAVAKIGTVAAKDERDAVYDASSRGLGMASAALTLGLRKAQAAESVRTSEAAIAQNVEYANMLREDAKTIYGIMETDYANRIQSIQVRRANETARYSAIIAHFTAQVQAEGERRGWSQMQINDILTRADAQARYALGKAQAILAVLRETDTKLADLSIGLFQAVCSTIGLSLSGSGSQSVNESV